MEADTDHPGDAPFRVPWTEIMDIGVRISTQSAVAPSFPSAQAKAWVGTNKVQGMLRISIRVNLCYLFQTTWWDHASSINNPIYTVMIVE